VSAWFLLASAGIVRTVAVVVERFYAWQDRARERANLMTLDDRALKDIGLTRCDVAEIAQKPFWRV
jgi:uncharacterized protein YjiS (DUF1127 family)